MWVGGGGFKLVYMYLIGRMQNSYFDACTDKFPFLYKWLSLKAIGDRFVTVFLRKYKLCILFSICEK